ncbi:hypothetical protein [Symbioplanes lichenis]|uniref:hypothetical protein n=1 Tax=Symbioplanes lichenis TaxID=1629072 RepID=UPI0027382A38|nr:hypothetical protein [Actinoplanes lichenis]
MTSRQDATADKLAATLLPGLRAEAAFHGLYGPVLAVRWRKLECPGPPARPAHDGEVRDLPRLLDDLPRRRLVVLGEAGAGKTSAGLLTALTLLGRHLPAEKIPVPVGLNDWEPARETLSEHLVRQVAPVVGRPAAIELVGGGHLLPIFDDVFEPAPDAASCPITAAQAARVRVEALIAALNRSTDGFVVLADTVRYREATRLGPELDACHVVLEPVAAEEARSWLRRSVAGVAQLAEDKADSKVARCADLVARLDRAPGGADVLGSPRRLGLLEGLIYGRPDAVRELPDGDAGAITSYLYQEAVAGCEEALRSIVAPPRVSWLSALRRRGRQDMLLQEAVDRRLLRRVPGGYVIPDPGLRDYLRTETPGKPPAVRRSYAERDRNSTVPDVLAGATAHAPVTFDSEDKSSG